MHDLNYVAKLEKNNNFFNKNFEKLGEFYNLRHHDKILNHIKKHKGLIVVLNKLQPYLIKTFPNARFDLIYYTDPEVNELSQVILYIKVDEYTFHNGAMEEIDAIDFKFIPLMQKLNVIANFSMMPALYEW